MRLFIAINFECGTRGRLVALRDELSGRSARGRFSLTDNLHLTLAFLGECSEGQASAAKAAMDAISFEAFDLTIEGIGRFKRDGGDIWWAGVKKSKGLMELQGDLTDRLLAAGFTLDKRKYSPHITLGREVKTDETPWQIVHFGETVSSIELMKSERIAGKLTYTAIYKSMGNSIDV